MLGQHVFIWIKIRACGEVLVMNLLWVSQRVGNFLSSWRTVSFSRTLLYGVGWLQLIKKVVMYTWRCCQGT